MSIKNYLVEEITKHNHSYWILGSPKISDEDYDVLKKQLRDIDPYHPLVHKIETPKVEHKSIKISKIKHKQLMLSLDKAYTPDELFNWCKKTSRNDDEEFIISPKLDGWAAEFISDKKILSTRGDGEYGDDLSSKIPMITACNNQYYGPLKDCPIDFIGEILISKDIFIKYIKNYKTERSALQGILGRDEISFNFECLEMVSYDYLFNDSLSFKLKDFYDVDWDIVIEKMKSLKYGTDGLVIKLRDVEYSKSLGNTSHHPRWQIALKPKNPKAFTIVKSFKCFVGKDKRITPVIYVEPVDILGHTIQRASVHNYKELRRLDIHIGDKVLIERCGEIIPQIKQCFPGETREKIVIDKCPSCNGPIKKEEIFIYCINEECKGSLIKRLYNSFERLGFENLGPSITERLIDVGVKQPHQIFELTRNDLSQIKGFQQRSVDNLFNEIQRIKNNKIEDWKILSSLNMTGIGRSLSKKILSKFTIYELLNINFSEFLNVEDFGHDRALSIYNLLKNNDSLNYYLNNFNIINIKEEYKNEENEMKKLKICFTGKMPEKRSFYNDLAIKNGYEPINSVTKDLDILVAMDVNSGSSKLKKAQKDGIKIVPLNDFLQSIDI